MDKPNQKADPKILARYPSLLLGLSALGVLSIIIYTIVYFQVRFWQAWIAVGVVASALLFAGPIYLIARAGWTTLAATLIMIGGAVALSANEIAWSGMTWYHIAGGLMLILLVGITLLPRRTGRYIGISTIYLVLILLANRINPIARHPVSEAPLLTLFVLGLDIFLAILLLTQVLIGSRTTSIRARLVVAFSLLVTLPLIATTIGSSYLSSQSQQNKTLDQLDATVSMKFDEIYGLIQDVQFYLGYVLPTSEEAEDWNKILLEDYGSSPEWNLAQSRIQNKFNSSLIETQVFEEISLLDTDGVIKASTYDFQVDTNQAEAPYFQEGLKSFYLNPPFNSLGQWSIVASMPVRNNKSEVIGVIIGRLIMNELNQMMMLTPGLGSTGDIYLVQVYEDNKYRVITPLDSKPYDTAGADIPTQSMSWITPESKSGKISRNNFLDEPVLSAYRYITPLQMYLIAEQSQAEAGAFVRNSLVLNIIVGVAALIIAVAAALIITRQMTRPLVKLGTIAEQIASGNLNVPIEVEQTDEVGALAASLNKMTRQLRGLISGLEERVSERTVELERRSNQLQVASQVARDTTAIHDLDSLMMRAVDLITERFEIYHAGIFLVDDNGEYAVLRAATGEAGKKMLDNGHRLRVGEEGIVGYVSGTGQPRIALDVGEDAVHFRNPLLPQTRSEMGLPLRSGDRVIGVLDVQSTRGSAFDQQDINILQTMSDQLAVAIENARLFNTMNDTLSQLQIAQQEYTQETWQTFSKNPQRAHGYRYRGIGVETYETALPINEDETVINVPLKIRDQNVGNIRLKLENPTAQTELQSTVEEISNRLSIVLESARLLEETQLRSEQIHLLQEVTSSASMNIELNALFNEVIQKIVTGFNFDHCSILMFDPDLVNGTLVASKNSLGEDTGMTGERIQISNSPLLIELLNNEKSLAVYNAVRDPRAYSLKEYLTQLNADTFVLSPIVVRGEVEGAILMDSTDITRRLSEEDLRLLDQIGLQVSVGVDVARLFELTEKRAEREQLIGEIANRMRESLEIDKVLQTAAREMRKALNLDDVTIQLTMSENQASLKN